MQPLLLTPGPLTTSAATRARMAVDYGSRDPAFTAFTTRVREGVAALSGDADSYVCIPLQGSGTFAVEAAIGTLIPPHGKLLVIINGAYGRRIQTIAERLGLPVTSLETAETEPPDLKALDDALQADDTITHVAVIHCETTTGLLNPVGAIAEITARHGVELLVDAMSAFGAVPLNAAGLGVSAVMASSNKCLEGVPGVGLVIVRKDVLAKCRGQSPSLALDLYDQQARFDQDGQWRFTPPTHVVASLASAVDEHAAEGGVAGRGGRYTANCRALVSGMRARGFRTLLPDALQAPIIVTFHDPADPAYDFVQFYNALCDRGFAIYPGKLTQAPTFRVGCIGQVFTADIERFLITVDEVLAELGVSSGAPGAGTEGF